MYSLILIHLGFIFFDILNDAELGMEKETRVFLFLVHCFSIIQFVLQVNKKRIKKASFYYFLTGVKVIVFITQINSCIRSLCKSNGASKAQITRHNSYFYKDINK